MAVKRFILMERDRYKSCKHRYVCVHARVCVWLHVVGPGANESGKRDAAVTFLFSPHLEIEVRR